MDRRSSSISLYAVGCKRRSFMFTCSVDQGGARLEVAFRFLPRLQIGTVVVCYTQVSQVRIEGTELRKRYGKKEMKKNVPSRARKFLVQIAQSKAVSVFLLTFHAAEKCIFQLS